MILALKSLAKAALNDNLTSDTYRWLTPILRGANFHRTARHAAVLTRRRAPRRLNLALAGSAAVTLATSAINFAGSETMKVPASGPSRLECCTNGYADQPMGADELPRVNRSAQRPTRC